MNDALLARRAEVFAALGDPNRIRLINMLLQRGFASIATLSAPLAISRQAVAKHLGVLEEAGLVGSDKRGREVLFHVQSGAFTVSTEWLEAIAGKWERRLEGIKAVAEGDEMVGLRSSL